MRGKLSLFLLSACLASLSALADEPAQFLHEAAQAPPPGAAEAAATLAAAPAELDARLSQGTSILLRAGLFDPLNEKEPSLQGLEAFPEKPGDVLLVQFWDDPSPQERASLERAGVKFLDYIPSHAYVVRASGEALKRLESAPAFRWAGPYKADYKIDPMLMQQGWTTGVLLDVRLFSGENAFLLLSDLQRIDPTVGFASLHGEMAEGSTLRIFVPAGHLRPFVDEAAREPAVQWIAPWFLPHVMNNNSVWVMQSYDTTDTTNYTLSATIWNHGITGTGQTPAVSDTGCDDDMCFFRYSSSSSAVTNSQAPTLPGIGTLEPAKKVIAYYVIPGATAYDGNTSCNGNPESEHGTHTTCSVLGDNYATLSTPTSGGHDNGDGMAPNAKLIFQDVGSETTGCLDGLSTDNNLIFQQAYNAGARIHSNSWGGDTAGAYTSDCQLIDRFIYNHDDFQFFFANGNAGSAAQTVGSPATAKDCISIGATGVAFTSENPNTIASYSSRGPTADGRRKPDVCAPGAVVLSASGDASHTSNNCGTKTMDGTSMATPTAAGSATLLRQYFTDGFYPTGAKNSPDAVNPSAALLKAALINGAVDISYTTQATMLNGLTPDNNQGFGRVCLDTACFFSTPSRDARRLRVWDRPNAAGLTTGQQEEFPLQVASGQPLKVTLVWTDPEASTAAAVTLVNNLDLEVVAPNGSTLYKGNVFSGGQSTTGGSADALNTVEEVFLTAPTAGTWTLRVKGTSVPGTPAEPYSARQGFALVATYADCTSGPAAAPASLTATNNGTTGIDLSWPAVTGATGYQIYRVAGNCSAAAGDYRYIGKTTGTTFTDTLVQGGYAYAYEVRAVNGCSEGPLSPCATATYSGNCTMYPTFGGLVSALNDTSTPACDVLLSWSAGSSNCPLGNSVSYNVYRGVTPYFTIGAASRVATGVVGTSYRDAAVTPNVTCYYVVRAEDGTTLNGGPANGGNEDLNRTMLSATPTANTTFNGTWSDAGGDNSQAFLTLDSPWRVTNQQNHTAGGSYCYHSAPDGATYPPMQCASATTPVIPLQAGQSPVLTFWERFNLEYQWDGVVVEISDNGGAWTQLAITPDYPSTFAQTGSPAANACSFASTVKCFTGPSGNAALSAWTSHTANLAAYAGHNVQIRWRLSSDPGAEYDGFYLDDISITYAGVPMSCGSDVHLQSKTTTDYCSGGGVGSGDGYIDPGEEITVQATLINRGAQTATNVSSTMSSSTPGVTVTIPTESFPDIASGATASAPSPYFKFTVGQSVACGATLNFTLHTTCDQGSWDDAFTLTVGHQVAGSPTSVLAESFDGTTFPPANWTITDVSGTSGNWTRMTTSSHPTGITPHSGAGMAAFNSYTATSGDSTRLAFTTPFSIPATATAASVNLWVYHDTAYTTSNDRIQVQAYYGSAWNNVGAAVPRYDGSTGWKLHTIDLSQAVGQSNIQLGFLGISAYGNDTHMDDVSASYTDSTCVINTCTPVLPPGEVAPGDIAATAQSWTNKTTLGWPAAAGATGYNVYRGVLADLPNLMNTNTDSCTKYTGSATSCTVNDDPSQVAGKFYWYLVTGTNGGGEGTAGVASTSACATPPCTRVVNSTGTCP